MAYSSTGQHIKLKIDPAAKGVFDKEVRLYVIGDPMPLAHALKNGQFSVSVEKQITETVEL